MAKTTVNLTDTVTNWVTKTNQISNTIGRKGLNCNTVNKSVLVSKAYISYTQKAIDYLNEFNGDPKQHNHNSLNFLV